MLGALISRGLGLLAAVVTVRILGADGFGEFGTIQNTVGMFTTFGIFGLGLTATKYVAQYRETDPRKAGRVMALSELFAGVAGLVVALVLLFAAPWMASAVLSKPQLAGPLRIGAVLLFLGAVNNAQTGALSGLEAFKAIAQVNLWAGLASFPLCVAGVLFWGLPGAVWGMTGAGAANVLLSHWALRRAARAAAVPFQFAHCLREARILWSFSFPAVLSSLLTAPVFWILNVMQVNRPGGYHEWGVFSAANQWRTTLLFLPNTLSLMILPILASLEAKGDRDRQRKVLWYNIVFIGGVTTLAALAVVLLAPVIMRLYGKEFVAGAGPLILLMFSAVLSATIGVIGQSIASANKMWWGMLLNLVWAAALIAAAWNLVPRGATGLAWAVLIAYGLHLATVSAYTYWFIVKK